MIKQQVRIEPDYTEEDTLLTDIGESAEETCLEYCNRTYGDIIDQYGAVPKNIVRASLLLCTIGYEQRSGVSMQNLSIVPYGNFDLLLKPYEVLAGSKDGGDEYQAIFHSSQTCLGNLFIRKASSLNVPHILCKAHKLWKSIFHNKAVIWERNT